ncbi:MAG: very short patch repair endonuclease [Rubrivivax sp.]|nr:very short patch repair endonuclease [Rubrivivax sp.]
MTDVLTAAQRQLNMSRIRGRDTKPEMLVRQGLHARGLRYRLHDRKLPGRPDLVFAQYQAAVFVHGCFWHAHGCALSKLPATRQDFWKQKLEGNAARDRRAIDALQAAGWRVLVIWECALRGVAEAQRNIALDAALRYIRTESKGMLELQSGTDKAAQR